MNYCDGSIGFGSLVVKGTSKDGAPLGDFVLEAVQLNPDGSGWLISQINNEWLIEGDTLETDLRGQFGKIAVKTQFSFTTQTSYRTQLIGFGGIEPFEFDQAIKEYKTRTSRCDLGTMVEPIVCGKNLGPGDVVSRLCELCTYIADKRFKNSEPADCFCSGRPVSSSEFRFSEQVLKYVKDAVYDFMVRDGSINAFKTLKNPPDLGVVPTRHLIPPKGSVRFPCCGKTPLEVPRVDAVTDNPDFATCRGNT